MTLDPTNLDALREEVLAGRLNRRSVLKRAFALGLSAPVIAGLLAACGDDDDDDDDGGEATSPAATTGTGAGESTSATGGDATVATGDGEASPTTGSGT